MPDDRPLRRFVAEHAIDSGQTLKALVVWNGDGWIVTINDDLLPDCCSTIEEAFSVAERELARRLPDHICVGCKGWQNTAGA